MTKAVGYFLTVFFSFSLLAAEGASVAKPSADSRSGPSPWLVELRAGLVTSNPDQAVTSKHWEHDPLRSYLFSFGGLRTFPQAWTQVRFFVGSEFLYMTAKEEMSGAYNATIDITIMEWLVQSGAEWRPFWWGGDIGFRLATKYALWSEKTSKLDAEGFNQDLGREDTRVDQGLIDIPLIFAATAFYDMDVVQLSVNLDVRPKGSTVTAGVGYAF